MIHSKIYILLACCGLLSLSGCKDGIDITEPDKVPISFSGSNTGAAVTVHSRAESFSGKTLSVVAVNATATSTAADVNWSDYYLNHVPAAGTSQTVNGEDEIVLSATAYWPFNPAEYLFFAAYGPSAGSDTRVSRTAETNTLVVTAGTDNAFPDLIYSGMVGPYNKVSAQQAPNRTVSLGVFNHAMAKLIVEVKLVDEDGNDIPAASYPPHAVNITGLQVLTKAESASLDITAASKVWSLGMPLTTARVVRTFIASSTALTVNLPQYTCFMLPGTEDDSFLSIGIDEGIEHHISVAPAISEFTYKDGEVTKPVTLEMGKTTLLTVKIKYVAIPDPERLPILQGQLVEWDYKGESQVTIE